MTRDDYIIAHLRDALATAPEVGALDITVQVSDQTVYLSGVVDCESKRKAAREVVRRNAPDFDVVNQLTVLRLLPVDPPEELYDSSGRHR